MAFSLVVERDGYSPRLLSSAGGRVVATVPAGEGYRVRVITQGVLGPESFGGQVQGISVAEEETRRVDVTLTPITVVADPNFPTSLPSGSTIERSYTLFDASGVIEGESRAFLWGESNLPGYGRPLLHHKTALASTSLEKVAPGVYYARFEGVPVTGAAGQANLTFKMGLWVSPFGPAPTDEDTGQVRNSVYYQEQRSLTLTAPEQGIELTAPEPGSLPGIPTLGPVTAVVDGPYGPLAVGGALPLRIGLPPGEDYRVRYIMGTGEQLHTGRFEEVTVPAGAFVSAPVALERWDIVPLPANPSQLPAGELGEAQLIMIDRGHVLADPSSLIRVLSENVVPTRNGTGGSVVTGLTPSGPSAFTLSFPLPASVGPATYYYQFSARPFVLYGLTGNPVPRPDVTQTAPFSFQRTEPVTGIDLTLPITDPQVEEVYVYVYSRLPEPVIDARTLTVEGGVAHTRLGVRPGEDFEIRAYGLYAPSAPGKPRRLRWAAGEEGIVVTGGQFTPVTMTLAPLTATALPGAPERVAPGETYRLSYVVSFPEKAFRSEWPWLLRYTDQYLPYSGVNVHYRGTAEPESIEPDGGNYRVTFAVRATERVGQFSHQLMIPASALYTAGATSPIALAVPDFETEERDETVRVLIGDSAPPQILSANRATFYRGVPNHFQLESTDLGTTFFIEGAPYWVHHPPLGESTLGATPPAEAPASSVFTIRAINQILPDAEQSFTLEVVDAPSALTITGQPLHAQVMLQPHLPGQAHYLNVLVAGGSPPYAYQWYKDGAPMAGATEAWLTLPDIQPSDSGLYTVVITDASHSVTSRPARLLFGSRPVAPEEPWRELRVAEGGRIVLRGAEPSGDSSPQYQWFFDPRDGSEPEAIAGATGPELVLDSVRPESAGAYFYHLYNTFGWTIGGAQMLTVGPPADGSFYGGSLVAGDAPVGEWTWYRRRDGTEVLLLLRRVAPASAWLVQSVQWAENGQFSGVAQELVPWHIDDLLGGRPIGEPGATRLLMTGILGSDGQIQGEIDGRGLSFAGGYLGETADLAGYYRARALGQMRADAHALVRPDGLITLWFRDEAIADGTSAWLSPEGGFGVLNDGVGAYVQIDGTSRLWSAGWLRGGSLGALQFAGARTDVAPSRLMNVSTIGQASSGQVVMIAGFVIDGSAPRNVLVRGVGPSLGQFLPEGSMLSRTGLALYRGQELILDGGQMAPQPGSVLAALGHRLGAFTLTPEANDAVLVTSLEPGVYTAHLHSGDPQRRTGMVEVYDAGQVGTSEGISRLMNISTLGQVGPGELIAGFVIEGSQPQRVLVRAAGRGAVEGMTDASFLEDPKLRLVRGTENLAENDDWTGHRAIAQAAARTGAFPLAEGTAHAAILTTLEPGVYSAVVESKNGAEGLVLVEVYVVPE